MLHSYPLEDVRRFYAEEIRAAAGLRNERLAEAFARVPREAFLGPGPWLLAGLDRGPGLGPAYRPTPDADPRHVYHDVAISLDRARDLNNGQPASLAVWMDALDLHEGARVFHLGSGTGYYTAILAETVGPSGHVLAVEVDSQLAERARQNLAGYAQVEVVEGDGGALDPGPRDAIFINAGVSHPLATWLDCLQPGGALVFPLTMTMPGSTLGKGVAMRVRREGTGFSAFVIGFVAIYSCSSVRDPQLHPEITRALTTMSLFKAQSLRRDAHERCDTCIVHAKEFCFSAMPIAAATAS